MKAAGKDGMNIGTYTFKKRNFTVIYRDLVLKKYKSVWFVSLTSDQYYGEPKFDQFYQYVRKLKDAIEADGSESVCNYKGIEEVSNEDYMILFNEIKDHEEAYKVVSKSNGVEVIELDDDVDYSDI